MNDGEDRASDAARRPNTMSPENVPTSMSAIVLRHRPSGKPVGEDFALETRPLRTLATGDVLVRNIFMSVDPSMRGRLGTSDMHYTTNFTVGEPLDGSAIGRVIASRDPDIPVGAAVRHRLGWRDFAVVPAGSGRTVDEQLGSLSTWLGALGQTGFTAYVGLIKVAGMRPGDVVFVSAAAGAVGSIAGQIARSLGASRVVGSTGSDAKCTFLRETLGFDDAFNYRTQATRHALAQVAPDGIDVYFDNVGGDQLAGALVRMNRGGRVALCGQISQFATSGPYPDLMLAILKRLTLRGFIVRDHEDLREDFEVRMSNWLRTGAVIPQETIVDGLDRAVEAFLGMLSGANVGKMLVRIDSDEFAP